MFAKLSLIITTYNWPDALELVLQSVRQQNELPFEVIIADDGSTEQTRQLIDRKKTNFPCLFKHVWQEDNGYQGARIRNKAVKASEGDSLIFIDGDCVLRADYIEQQKRLAKPGYFIAGNRVLLSETYTRELLNQSIDITRKNAFDFDRNQLNRRWALLRLPFDAFRRTQTRQWKGAKTCNLSLPRENFIAVNGFDESFEGWGHEDSDLVIRLINNGVKRMSGRFALTVLHLWHRTIKSSDQTNNWDKLLQTLNSNRHLAQQGINQQH